MANSKFRTPTNVKVGSVVNSKVTPPPPRKKVVAFFIGGAGDKESYYGAGPYNNILFAKQFFDSLVKDIEVLNLYKSYYRGYNEARGEDDIKNQFTKFITDKSTPIYLVGHSLGGWNGAHLSQTLTDDGYTIEMLITLDPVGNGPGVYLISDIYFTKPKPRYKFWINIRAESKFVDTDFSDLVANVGEQWAVNSGPNINSTVEINHLYAKTIFRHPIKDGKSAAAYMLESVRKITK
jgi:pimeloyl-ACP methyl ester carboxylesterase